MVRLVTALLMLLLVSLGVATAGAPKRCPPGYHNRCGSTCKVRCVVKDEKTGKCLRKDKVCPPPSCYCEQDK